MAKYRKKPIIIEAEQWFKKGDHEQVRPYFWPISDQHLQCPECDKPLPQHGQVKTLEGYHIVCPGDWIIRGIAGEYYACKPTIFTQTYDPVGE